MKKLNKALISTAVLAGLYAGNAFAGTEACFEIYKGVPETNHTNGSFGGADCYTTAATPARVAGLAAIVPGSVAYELTKGGTNGFQIDLNNVAFRTGAPNAFEGVQIVYIPTTDIPGASRIKVALSGAEFFGNANQIFLLSPAGDILATSDGVVDGKTEVEFLTQSGVTIPAGTRMLFSKTNGLTSAGATLVPAEYATHVPVGIRTTNTACVDGDSKRSITIQATTARTDGGSSIIGGVSRAEKLIDISPQFYTFLGSPTVGQVNAQTTNHDKDTIVARSEFVYTTTDNKGLTLRKTELVAPFTFVDRGLATAPAEQVIDLKHTLVNADKLNVKFSTTSDAGASARFYFYNDQDNAAGVTNGAVSDAITLGANTHGVLGTNYVKDAPLFFTRNEFAANAEDGYVPSSFGALAPDAASNTVFVTVVQSDTTDPITPLGFNYNINVESMLDLDGSTLLDHCTKTTTTHNVGINGAVLKVPYSVSGAGNFVRITNEHNQEAEVTVDVFGESVDGTVGARHATAVRLANIPAKSSYVYFVPEIIDAAVAQKNYSGADGAAQTANSGNPLRHTLTFAVTAPKDTVHGVTVQRLSTGNDRVMPVLDQNTWAQ